MRVAHLGLILIGLIWVFPFFICYHAYPRTTFYQEWSTAILGLVAMALLAAPPLFVLVWSGSRSAWLYLLWMAGMAWLWPRRDKSCLPLLRYSLLLLLGFGMMHLVVLIPQSGWCRWCRDHVSTFVRGGG